MTLNSEKLIDLSKDTQLEHCQARAGSWAIGTCILPLEQRERAPLRGPASGSSFTDPALGILVLKCPARGTWVAQLVKRPTSAQVMISQFVSSGPTSGSVLSSQSLEPASDSVSPHLSVPPMLMLCLSLSLNNK